MRILDLTLKNIGPFDDAHVEFAREPLPKAPVAIITGENGAGKTILLDAIRAMFGLQYANLERNIARIGVPVVVSLAVSAQPFGLHSIDIAGVSNQGQLSYAPSAFGPLPVHVMSGGEAPPWVVDYWRSALATDPYVITNLVTQNPRLYLRGSLQGTYRNADVTEQICYFDYLRDSKVEKERRAGEILYDTIKKIVRASLLDGELDHVARSTFMPMVRQSGQLVSLSNLSSGNAYLIQRLISLLGKMYAVHVLRDTPPETLCETPGLLLIDEAENHLHPKWQKRFIPGILSVFPNLQIIATTHSPFIISSVPDARVFVCRYDADKKTCVVEDETGNYANKPVEEILLSAAFSETQPFNEEISNLIEQRKRAVEGGDEEARRTIEKELKQRNPDYFSYFDVEERLKQLGGPKKS